MPLFAPLTWTNLSEWLNSTTNRLDGKDWRLQGTLNVKTYLVSRLDPITVYVTVAVLILLALPGNAAIFSLSFSRKIRHHSYSVYLGALSITDSMWLGISYVGFMLRINDIVTLKASNSHDLHLCRFLYFAYSFFKIISPWIRLAMSIDCYVYTMFWKWSRKVCTPVVALTLLLMTSLAVLALELPFALAVDPMYFRGQYICALYDPAYTSHLPTMEIVGSLLPAVLIGLTNLHALLVVKVCRKSPADTEGGAEDAQDPRQTTGGLVVVNFIASVLMLPSTVIMILLLQELPRNIATTDYEQLLADALPKAGLLYSVFQAGSFYLLLCLCPAYRRVALRSRACCLRARAALSRSK